MLTRHILCAQQPVLCIEWVSLLPLYTKEAGAQIKDQAQGRRGEKEQDILTVIRVHDPTGISGMVPTLRGKGARHGGTQLESQRSGSGRQNALTNTFKMNKKMSF